MSNDIVSLPLPMSQDRVAKWWACWTHDLVVVSSRPGWGKVSFRRIFASHLCFKHVRKAVGDWKESSISKEVRKQVNSYASPTAMIDHWKSEIV